MRQGQRVCAQVCTGRVSATGTQRADTVPLRRWRGQQGTYRVGWSLVTCFAIRALMARWAQSRRAGDAVLAEFPDWTEAGYEPSVGAVERVHLSGMDGPGHPAVADRANTWIHAAPHCGMHRPEPVLGQRSAWVGLRAQHGVLSPRSCWRPRR